MKFDSFNISAPSKLRVSAQVKYLRGTDISYLNIGDYYWTDRANVNFL